MANARIERVDAVPWHQFINRPRSTWSVGSFVDI
jgi:hypothetical protein